MSKGYLVRNAAGQYLRREVQETWTAIREEATVFNDLATAEGARRDGNHGPRTLWDTVGRQIVARQLCGEWFATVVGRQKRTDSIPPECATMDN